MSPGPVPRMALGLAAVLLLSLAPAALARGLKLDPSEVATLGASHAREHARDRLAIEQAQKRAARMSPGARLRSDRAARRSALRVSRVLGDRPRDDIGYWEPTQYPLPQYAINMTLMPTGELLYFGRPPPGDNGRPNFGDAEIFNPATHQSRAVDPPSLDGPGGLPANIFCSGQLLLSDGRVLVVGGQLRDVDATHPNYSGLQYTFLFDPWKEKLGLQPWTIGPKMTAGRWYPTAAKLPSGDVLIMSGLDENGQGDITPQMDLFRPGIDDNVAQLPQYPGGFRGESPDLPPGSPADRVQSLYPRMFTIPDGNVLLAGPSWADSAKLNTATATDPSAPLGSAWTNYSTQPSIRHLGGPAVLEPDMSSFGGSWRALLLGGIPASDGLQLSLATRVVERMNADPAGTPGWEAPDPAEQLTKARYYHNDVLLPDGGMVVVGGGSGSDPTTYIGNYYIDPSDSTRDELRQVELRRPGEKTWRLGAAQEEWRTYHGTAALLPDGRILSAGDDYHEGPDPFNPLPDSTRRDSAEIYWPPYLFNGNTCAPRPVIRAVGATAPPAGANDPWAVTTYAEPFGIFSDHARSGMQAVLVAPAADTHAFDFTQRVIPLKVTSVVTGGGLNVLTPANAAIAQPGWYELYVIDADGTPSVGRWVRLLAPAGADANRDGPPITVTGTWPNPSPRSCVNPDGSTVTEGVTPPPPPPPPAPVPPAVTFTSKLTVKHISIRRSSRELDLLASITTRASGRVKVELVAGSHRATFHPTISSAKGRIQIKRKIPASLAARRTALVTITYLGDADTRPLSVRLLVGPHAAKLTMTAPKLTSGGRIKTNGTISRHARGSVRVQLEFELGETTKTVQLTARVSKGAWKLSKQLSKAVRAQIAARTGTLHSYTVFTGYKPAGIRGEMRSYEVLGDP